MPDAIRAAAPTHVAHVRDLFVDRLTDEELAAVRVAAQKVVAGLGLAGVALPGEQ